MKWNDFPSKLGGIFLPIFLLSLGMVGYLYWQMIGILNMQDLLVQTIDAQQAPVSQTNQTEAKFNDLVLELLQLAKEGDPDALGIVKKYDIVEHSPAPKP